jgi:preprotein translocase subunit SecG
MGIYVLVAVLIIITCVLLGLVVLVQNSKGGGLASNFASSNQFMGVRKTADFLEKATWTLAVVLLVLSLTSILIIPRNRVVSNAPQSEIQQKAAAEQTQQKPIDYQAPPANP